MAMKVSEVVEHMLSTQENFHQYGYAETVEMVRGLEAERDALKVKLAVAQIEGFKEGIQHADAHALNAQIEALEWVADNAPMSKAKWWDKLDQHIAELKAGGR